MITQEPRGEVRGRVINISSQHGMVGAPGNVAYSAMKGGVVNLTRQIAVDFAEHGIVCNAIAPGKIVVPREGGQDPELLSYLIAASLNVEVNRRQELLEEDSVSGRLRKCLQMLRREAVFLDQMLARRDHIVPVSLN
jgi:NAD(P)-dependent dehydrogenase (short-subunit alcohol dehydrogenase family)